MNLYALFNQSNQLLHTFPIVKLEQEVECNLITLHDPVR